MLKRYWILYYENCDTSEKELKARASRFVENGDCFESKTYSYRCDRTYVEGSLSTEVETGNGFPKICASFQPLSGKFSILVV